MKGAVNAVGGCDAILLWLGENDAVASMSQATYHSDLASMVASVQSDLACPVLPCQLQTFTSATGPQQAAINAAIAQAWGDVTGCKPGPDMRAIPSAVSGPNDVGDTVHLKSDAKLCQAGGLWASATYKALFQPTGSGGAINRGILTGGGY
jgi:hypothetical protein